MEEDEHDRKKEKDELEALRLEVMERQIREMEEQQKKQKELIQEQQNSVIKEEEETTNDTITVIDENIPISKEDEQPVSFIKVN